MTLTRFQTLLREHFLHVLFPPAAAWLLLLLFVGTLEDLQRLNRFPEGTGPHALFEAAAIWLPVMVALASAVFVLWRLPGVLRLPPSIPLTRIAGRLVRRGFVLFAANATFDLDTGL